MCDHARQTNCNRRGSGQVKEKGGDDRVDWSFTLDADQNVIGQKYDGEWSIRTTARTGWNLERCERHY